MSLSLIDVRDGLPDGFRDLVLVSEQEGYGHIRRLATEWTEGHNRFTSKGEKLVVCTEGKSIAGVGGITVEPVRADYLRMRRFYVRPESRGRGAGRAMAERLLTHARAYTKTVTVHAGDEHAAMFWQALGFRPVDHLSYTHVAELG